MAIDDPLAPVGKGHTELSDEDRQGLLPSYIATRADLFDAEQRNIAEAMLRRRPTVDQLLDDKFLRDLHRAMFGDVWAWAGKYRSIETNIGIDASGISMAVRDLVADTRTWVEFTTHPIDELAVRFHHRLVAIHPFPNGNGRHGRIATDFLVAALGADSFSWGSHLEVETDDLRHAYVEALRSADGGRISKLLAFART